MKVIQVLPDLNGGGVERGTLEVAQALVEAGHESVVVSGGGGMVAELEASGSRHVCWNLGRKSLATLRHIWAVRNGCPKKRRIFYTFARACLLGLCGLHGEACRRANGRIW